MNSPILFNTIKILTHKHAQRPDSQVVMDSVKLTISTNYNIKPMSSLINNRIEKLTHIYEYIYTFSVIHLVIHFLLENNTNKEAAYTMHKDQIIVIQKKIHKE